MSDDLFIKVLQKPLSLKTWEGAKTQAHKPEDRPCNLRLISRQAGKCRGVTVTKSCAFLRNFCLFLPSLFPSFK